MENYLKIIGRKINAMQKDIVFDDLLHKYWYKGKAVISTTQLLAKHKITASYGGVNEEVLEAARERGNEIHLEIENHIKHGEIGESYEFEQFLRIMKEQGLTPIASEFRVANEIVAGTIDILAFNEEGRLGLIDVKTGVYYKNSVEWQLSIYNEIGKLNVDFIGCIHLPKAERGNCSYKGCNLKTQAEIEDLFNAEVNGDVYTEMIKEAAVEVFDKNKELEKVAELEIAIKTLDAEKKKIEAKRDELKAVLIKEMKTNNLKTVDFGEIQITYVAPTSRDTLDGKRLKEEMPELYKDFVKTSPVKESLKITIREVK